MFETKQYREIVDSFHAKLLETDEKTAGIKLSEEKWSLKEIIGHLVDSASNNHQRFVRLQFGDLPDFPPYATEEWVRIQQYNKMDWSSLVALWYNYNRLLINIIENVDENACCNVWVRNGETIRLDFLIPDYYRHLKVHVEHFEKRLKEISS